MVTLVNVQQQGHAQTIGLLTHGILSEVLVTGSFFK